MYSSHSQWVPAGASLPRARRGRGIAKVSGGWEGEEREGRGGEEGKRRVERGGGRREEQDGSGEGNGEGWKGGRVERGGGKGEKGNGMVEKEGGRRGICFPYTRFVMLGVKRVGGRWECFSDPHPVCQLITSFSWYSIEKA